MCEVDFALLKWVATVRTMRFPIFGFARLLSVPVLVRSARSLLLAFGMMLLVVGRFFGGIGRNGLGRGGGLCRMQTDLMGLGRCGRNGRIDRIDPIGHIDHSSSHIVGLGCSFL